ncbi:hypothetical protein [Thiocystis violascens]|uniref:hypothetical protein n=1 Tax=Thiocystis violascens TaxID=73141 RepID=UPI0003108D34|nr:hypothetical protein [Thiocystis violascens]
MSTLYAARWRKRPERTDTYRYAAEADLTLAWIIEYDRGWIGSRKTRFRSIGNRL